MKLFNCIFFLSTLSVSFGQQYLPPDSLKGYYSFSQSILPDESGNGNDGVMIGNYSQEVFQNSAGFYYYNGGYATMGDVDAFEGSGNLTLFAFIYTNGVDLGGDNDESEHVPIISKWSNVGSVMNSSYRVYLNGQRLVAEFSDGVTTDSLSYDIYFGLLFSAWTPVTIIFEAGQATIYESWLPVANKTLSISTINNSTTDFFVGNLKHDVDPSYPTFHGSIDEVMVYNRAVTLCELQNFHLEEYTFPLNIHWSTQCDCLTAEYFSTTNYQWYDCNSGDILVGSNTATLSPPSNGSYACIVTYENGLCTDTTECIEITNLGVEEVGELEHFKISPNPAATEIQLEFFANGNNESVAEIFSSDGSLIKSFDSLKSNSIIDVSDLTKGMYFVVLRDNSGYSHTEKLVIE